jgi:Transposase/zinc-finger of transposase IS204/IS1001/IS1096/IS1165
MRAGTRISSLVPSGLVIIESVSDSSDSIIIAVRAESGVAECPLCGARSSRIHSRYDRQAADLPCAGKEIRLRVITRRFVCEAPHCRRWIFAERFGDGVLPSRSCRTARLDCVVHHLGLVLGGRPAASLAKRLMLPVSNDTLLRVVRRRTALRTDPLTVVGIDDWAFRRNRRYGTIVCDLERRRIVTLLPDREVATVRAWLAKHPGIKIVSRDRGGGYGEAVAKALPDAIQVADRWHLMENASAASSTRCASPCAQSATRPVRRQSPPSCSPRQKNCGTRAICGERIQMRQSPSSPATACRSSRLSAAWGIVAISFDRPCVAGEPTCSDRGNARSTHTICSLRASGAAAVAMALNSGVACRRKGSRDPSASLGSRQHADVGRKRPANDSCKGFPRLELLPIS